MRVTRRGWTRRCACGHQYDSHYRDHVTGRTLIPLACSVLYCQCEGFRWRHAAVRLDGGFYRLDRPRKKF